ncbi:MAG: isopenicillin N synthase family oxygenase [Bdellovibrionaceae bacterium]|nr:isopenicillin N synthase family oxygenase [Pseudobdellovibrionaceae bacterium]
MSQVLELSLAAYTQGNESEKQKFIADLYRGLKDLGFIVLVDHPISEDLLKKAYALSEEFFNLPADIKKKYSLFDNGFQRGYTPFGTEHAKDSPVADLKEFWHVGRNLPADHQYENLYPKNIWPVEIPELGPTFSKIYQALEMCGDIMLEALTLPLELDKNYFKKMTKDGNSILRLLHYPPLPADRDPRSIRAAAHEDINLITLLVSASASGLELKDRNGQWLPVISSPNAIIVDSGDMLARITNEVIPSTTHRVVNPPDAKTSRYSMPFFMHPNPEAMLTCLPSCKSGGAKYPDILAEDFLKQRLREIGLLK